MENYNLDYFRKAKHLNEKHHKVLKSKELHFRGSLNSFSLVSVAKKTAEKGKSQLKTEKSAEEFLFNNKLQLEAPKRETKEKELQAWIINKTINNNGILPFGNNLQFITSELAIQLNVEELNLNFKFDSKTRVVNDILAIDDENNLCIIELKSCRDNYVKKQAIVFEKVIMKYPNLFIELVEMMTNKKWNGKCRKISVWPKIEGKIKSRKFCEVKEISYSEIDGTNDYLFEEFHFE